jgi:hypothetical protein
VSVLAQTGSTRRDDRRPFIIAALRAEWRMIGSVSLRPGPDGTGYEADVRLDPVVSEGSLEQQGRPRTVAALARIERRRLAALEGSVRAVNVGLPEAERIISASIVE